MSEWLNIYEKALSDDILSKHNFNKIKNALERGLIFGFRYEPGMGGPGERFWAFQSFDRLLEYIATYSRPRNFRPRNFYVVWSLAELLEKRVELARACYDAAAEARSSLLSPENMQAINDYSNNPSNEFLAIYYLANPPKIEVNLDDIGDFHPLLEADKEYCRSGGEIYVFPYTTLEHRYNAILHLDHILLAAAYRS